MKLNLISFLMSSITNGVPLLFGTNGEILTQKSGNLNLGVEGLMYMGGAFGLMGAVKYQNAAGEGASGILMVVIAIICAFAAGMAGSLIYSFITVTLKANQNVTGLALATFGTGVGKFIGETLKSSGSSPSIKSAYRPFFNNSPFSAILAKIPEDKKVLSAICKLLLGHNIFVYIGVVMVIAMAYFFGKTRTGLNLRAVGENPATADAAGINVERYKYLATVIGGGISALGGLAYIANIGGGIWDARALAGEGWIAVALVIFCLWKPLNTLWGSALFGALTIMYLRIPIFWLPSQIYKVMPFIVTAVVLIIVSLRQRREDQPPSALGLAYFREER